MVAIAKDASHLRRRHDHSTEYIKLDTKEWRSDLAIKYAEMSLTVSELKECRSAVELYFKIYSADPDETTVIQMNALYRSSIIQFIGCFGKGRFDLNARLIFSEAGNELAYYYRLKDLRDSYAAHRQGALRQSSMLVFSHPVSKAVQGIGNQVMV